MKFRLVILTLFCGIGFGYGNETDLILNYENINLSKTTSLYNDARTKYLKAQNDLKNYKKTLDQKYSRNCSGGNSYCVKTYDYIDLFEWDNYISWFVGNQTVSSQKEQKFLKLKKAIEQLNIDLDKKETLYDLVDFAKQNLNEAEYYKAIATIKQNDEEKAKTSYETTITFLIDFENAKQEYLTIKKENKEIEAQIIKLSKELGKLDKDLDRAKYNKIESELNYLQASKNRYEYEHRNKYYESQNRLEEELDKLLAEI